MNIQIRYLLKGMTTVAFILITGGMFAAWNTPMTGYEISAFTVTPVFYWIAFAFGLVTVFLILLAELLGKPVPKYLMIIKWILLAVCMLSLTMLLTLRGVYGLHINGDIGTHVGNLKDLLREGTVTSIYPNLYYFTAIFNLLTSLDIIYLTNIIPAIFVLIFIIGVFFAAREIFQNTRVAAVSAFVACALPFGTVNNYTGCVPLYDYVPYIQTLLAFSPFLIYVVYSIVNNRPAKRAYIIIGCLLLIAALFYHILAAAILLLFTLCVCIGLYLQKKFRGKEIRRNIHSLVVIAGATVIGWIAWTIYLGYMRIPVTNLYSLFLGDVGTVYSEQLNTQISHTVNYDITFLLDYAVKQFGSTGVLILILFISLIIAYIGYRKGKRYLNILPFIIVGLPLAGVAGLSILSSFTGVQPGRIVMFITIIGILFSGFALVYLLDYAAGKKISSVDSAKNTRGKRILSGVLAAGVVLSLFVLGIQTYYPGPEIYASLSDNTKSDVSGMQFYFEKSRSEYAYNAFNGYVPYRWADLIYGSDYTLVSNPVSPLFGDAMSFKYEEAGLNEPYSNYGDFNEISEAVDTPGYLIIGKGSLDSSKAAASRNVRDDNPYWLDNDMKHLIYDSSANSIYNTGEFNIYTIK